MKLRERLSVIGLDQSEKESAITCLESIIWSIRDYKKIKIKNTRKTINNNDCHPSDGIYCNERFIMIPEKIVYDIITKDSYMETESIVDILAHTLYGSHYLMPKNFYQELDISTPLEHEVIGCLVLNTKVFKDIIMDALLG